MMLETPDLPTAYTGVLRAVTTQPKVRDRVRDAVRHILAAKMKTARTTNVTGNCD